MNLEAHKSFTVAGISVYGENLLIKLEPDKAPITKYNPGDNWVKEYVKQNGAEPSFF